MQNLQNSIKVGTIGVSICTSNKEREYTNFELKSPVKNAKLIGTDDGDIFEVCFQSETGKRYGLAVYLDGVNVSQQKGIGKLSEVSTLANYDSHESFLSSGKKVEELNRYSQKSGENRKFTFTFDAGKSVNLSLIDEKATLNRIDVFLWEEGEMERTRGISASASRSASRGAIKSASFAGAGESTNKAYNTARGLRNPQYLGRAVFIHTPYKSNLEKLGSKFYSNVVDNLVEMDPMNLVPKS